MSETRVVPGGALSPPPSIADEDVRRFEYMLGTVRAGVPEDEWSEEVKATFEQARNNWERCLKRGQDLLLQLERVNEPGAAGPGRGLRLKATWTENSNGSARPRTSIAYPRSFKTEDIMYFIRNHLEYCYLVP